MFQLNRNTHVLSFHCKDVKLLWDISKKINTVSVRYFDETGYVEFDTNIGIESIDILDEDTDIEVKNKVYAYLKEASKLEVCYTET